MDLHHGHGSVDYRGCSSDPGAAGAYPRDDCSQGEKPAHVHYEAKTERAKKAEVERDEPILRIHQELAEKQHKELSERCRAQRHCQPALCCRAACPGGPTKGRPRISAITPTGKQSPARDG